MQDVTKYFRAQIEEGEKEGHRYQKLFYIRDSVFGERTGTGTDEDPYVMKSNFAVETVEYSRGSKIEVSDDLVFIKMGSSGKIPIFETKRV